MHVSIFETGTVHLRQKRVSATSAMVEEGRCEAVGDYAGKPEYKRDPQQHAAPGEPLER